MMQTTWTPDPEFVEPARAEDVWADRYLTAEDRKAWR